MTAPTNEKNAVPPEVILIGLAKINLVVTAGELF